LQRLHQELERVSGQPWALNVDGLARVLEDQEVCRMHLSLLPSPAGPKTPLQQHHFDGLKLKVRHQGLQALTLPEKRELLLEPESIITLANHITTVSTGNTARHVDSHPDLRQDKAA
jgi:hypothetical protein